MFGPRSARERWPKKLDQCNERIHTLEGNIQSLATEVEALRASVQGFEKEISDAGAAMANLRENIRVRKLMRDIETTTAEIESLDMEDLIKRALEEDVAGDVVETIAERIARGRSLTKPGALKRHDTA